MGSADRSGERPLIRRDAEGRERTAPDWETLTERLIREAQESGRFDDLHGQGRPLELADDSLAGDMAMAHHILRNAGAAPPWIETDKEIRAALERIEALLERAAHAPSTARPRLEAELERLADEHDVAARRLETLAPTARQARRPADRKTLRRRLAGAVDSER